MQPYSIKGCRELQREYTEREEKLSRKIERACEREIGCIWGFGFVSDYTFFLYSRLLN
jgi:hypothetical protein